MTILTFDANGGIVSSIPYSNVITGGIRNPRSEAWNIEVDREVIEHLLVRVAYQQRNTVHDLVSYRPQSRTTACLSLSNQGRDFYREFQIHRQLPDTQAHTECLLRTLQGYGESVTTSTSLGNDPQAVLQADARGPLSFDAPNRFLAWGEFMAPWNLTVMPVLEIHTGFPYSVVDQTRNFIGRATLIDSGSSIPSMCRC